MGLIERELRECAPDMRSIWDLSTDAFFVAVGAGEQLGFMSWTTQAARDAGCLPDLLSEAIEAASELGL